MASSPSLVTRASLNVVRTVKEELRETKLATLEIWRWGRKHDWKRTAKVMFRRKYWGWWFALALTTALSAVLSSYHQKIVMGISPYKHAIRHTPWSWIPVIIVLVIISFPPLFGHELVILAVGIIWGLGAGFAIACAGTFLGELACFYAFRYYLTDRAKKIEAKHVAYSCLAKMMRDGGVGISILVRFSMIPGHVTTAVQSTIGMSVWVYGIAAAFSLPKQFTLVYLGVVFGTVRETVAEWRLHHPEGSPKSHLSDYYSGDGSIAKRHRISLIVFAATTFATFIAGWVVWMRIRRIRAVVVAEMEEARTQAAKDIEEAETKDEMIVSSTGEFVVVTAPGLRDVAPASPRGIPWRADSATSQTALLSPMGRGRSGTASTGLSSMYSPSLPHLPLGVPADYFALAHDPEARTRGDSLGRRGSF